MRGFVPPDPETDVSQERFAVIQVAHRKRKRFPAGLVTVVADAETAIEQAGTGQPALVLGPSKSSEGQYVYYLVRWLSD